MSFLIKLQACNFIEKETLTQVFSCEFCKISKNIFFTEHLGATASAYSIYEHKKLLQAWKFNENKIHVILNMFIGIVKL